MRLMLSISHVITIATDVTRVEHGHRTVAAPVIYIYGGYVLVTEMCT